MNYFPEFDLPSKQYLNDFEEQLVAENYNGRMWKYFSRKQTDQGELITFKLEDTFNYLKHPNETQIKFNIDQANKAIYPAVEPNLQFATTNLTTSFLNRLGYSSEVSAEKDVFITLPNAAALQHAYNELKKTYPLPDLTIISVAGVAADHIFINAQGKGVLLSSGNEFVHDHCFHVIPRIYWMYKGIEKYYEIANKVNNFVNEELNKIEFAFSNNNSDKTTLSFLNQLGPNKTKVYCLVGMISDYLYSLKRENIENLALDQNFSVKFASLLKSSQWEPYLINRFEDSNIVDSIKFLWSTVEAAYKKHQLTLERNIALEDKAACQQRSSNLWECFARKKTEYGYIYKFKLKSEYNHNRITTESLARKITECIERKKLEIYPAAEPNAKQAVDWLNLEQLKHLGYKYYFDQESNLIIDLPDRETFINLYETLRESFPDLPKFEVFSSEGIAGDEDFSTANYRGTVLSSGQEFVHDHFYHLIRRLKRIFDGLASYQKTEYAIVHAINLIHHKIKWVLSDQVKCPKVDQVFKENLHNVEKIYSVLGMAADALSSQPTDSILNFDFTYDYSAQFVKNLGNSKWKPYLIRRFKDPNIVDSIQELWAIVEEACNA